MNFLSDINVNYCISLYNQSSFNQLERNWLMLWWKLTFKIDYSLENKSTYLHKLKIRVHTVNRIFYFAFYGDNFIIAKAQRCKSSWDYFKHLLFIITKQQLPLFNRAVGTGGGGSNRPPQILTYHLTLFLPGEGAGSAHDTTTYLSPRMFRSSYGPVLKDEFMKISLQNNAKHV